MSYDSLRVEMGKTPVAVVELDLDSCSLTYGVPPCTASGLGPQKCFNTIATCDDTPNYTKQTTTYRFSSVRIDELQQAGDPPTFPTLVSMDTSPTKLEPAKGLGVRSSVKIKIQDHPWTDEGTDPYLSERDFNPDDRGSFWARFLARNPFYQNRIIRIKQGYLNSDGTYEDANMSTRTYVIESINGPNGKGAISIVAKDILKFADKERAQLPIASEATLDGDLNDTATTFTINDPTGKIKTSFDGGQIYAVMEDEAIEMSNVTGSNGVYSVTCTRAKLPTFYPTQPEASEHDAGTTIQDCYYFDNVRVDDIIFYLLNTIAGIDASYLDTVQWDTKMDGGLQGYLFSRVLVEPTGVKEMLTELTEHTVTIYWDERAQKVLMDTLFDKSTNGVVLNDTDNIIDGSVSTGTDVKGRISQVWVSLGIRSPFLTDGDYKDYQQIVVRADLDKEGSDEYDAPSIRNIKSNWMPGGLGSIASEIASRLLRNYRVAKRIMTITVDPKDDDSWTADIIQATNRQIKDEFGNDVLTNYKITSAEEIIKPKGVRFKYKMQSEIVVDQETVGVITPNSMSNYRDVTEAAKNQYAFISNGVDATFPDGKLVNEIQ